MAKKFNRGYIKLDKLNRVKLVTEEKHANKEETIDLFKVTELIPLSLKRIVYAKLHYRGKKCLSPYTNHSCSLWWDDNLGVIKIEIEGLGQIHLSIGKYQKFEEYLKD